MYGSRTCAGVWISGGAKLNRPREGPGHLYSVSPAEDGVHACRMIVESILGSMSITSTAHEDPNLTAKWVCSYRRDTMYAYPSATTWIPTIDGDACTWLKVVTATRRKPIT